MLRPGTTGATKPWAAQSRLAGTTTPGATGIGVAGAVMQLRKVGAAAGTPGGVGEQGREIGAGGGAEQEAVVALQVLSRKQAADEPVELVGGAGQTQFLAELLEAEAEGAVVVAVEQVRPGEVDVRAVDRFPVPPGGDRGQGRGAVGQIDVGLGRQAHVLDVLFGAAVGVDVARERQVGRGGVVRRDRAADAGSARGQGVDDGARGTGHDLAGDAAVFRAVAVVGDQPDGGRIARQDQQLAARGPEVLVLVVGLGARAARRDGDVVEALALPMADVQTAGDLVGQSAPSPTRTRRMRRNCRRRSRLRSPA
jgi:hypothetical protein